MMKAGLVEISWTLVFQIINTVILFWFLKKLLFKPVTEFMEARQNGISTSIKEAEHKNQEADNRKHEYEAKLEKVQEEGRQILKEASKKAESKADEIIKEAQLEAEKLLNRAEAEIKRQNEKAMNELKDQIASLAVMAAGKVIEKSLDEENHNQLIKEFIDEVGDAKWHN
ncbi:F0F1 ATP synthase subunit B [Clostridiaceae bacterium 35-E11]